MAALKGAPTAGNLASHWADCWDIQKAEMKVSRRVDLMAGQKAVWSVVNWADHWVV